MLTILTLRLEDIFIHLGQKESLHPELLRIYWQEWLNIAAFSLLLCPRPQKDTCLAVLSCKLHSLLLHHKLSVLFAQCI